MRPKDLQKELGITADRIKFYKRERLFAPENPPSNNRSTNYTDADRKRLQLLEVLTKSGLTSGDIRRMEGGGKTLAEVAKARMDSIEADIERKQNALIMLTSLVFDHAELETLDTDHYWNVIHERETSGEKFIDVEDDYGYHPVSLVRHIRCPRCGSSHEVDLEEYTYDESSDERENGMGPDCVYSFDSGECYECPDCGSMLHIEGWVREYPMGAYDSEDVNVEVADEDNEE